MSRRRLRIGSAGCTSSVMGSRNPHRPRRTTILPRNRAGLHSPPCSAGLRPADRITAVGLRLIRPRPRRAEPRRPHSRTAASRTTDPWTPDPERHHRPHRTLCVPLATDRQRTPRRARPGIVGRCQKVALPAPMVVRSGIVRGCRRSASARMAMRRLPGDGHCQEAGSGLGCRGPARLISRSCPGRRLVCRCRAGLEPHRRCRDRAARGVRGTAVRGFGHSRCRRRAITSSSARRTGPRRVRHPRAG